MENKDFTKQVLGYQKAAFESGVNSLLMLQEQTSKVVDNFMRQSPWIPSQTKSMISDWTEMYKKGVMDFKEATQQNYSKMEELFSAGLDAAKPKAKN